VKLFLVSYTACSTCSGVRVKSNLINNTPTRCSSSHRALKILLHFKPQWCLMIGWGWYTIYPPSCDATPFICCGWCHESLCFTHFFLGYHFHWFSLVRFLLFEMIPEIKWTIYRFSLYFHCISWKFYISKIKARGYEFFSDFFIHHRGLLISKRWSLNGLIT
jgi:hypothetical protein